MNDSNIGKIIFIGLFTSALFVHFFDPIIRGVANLIIFFSSKVYSSFIDRLFAEAALGYFKHPIADISFCLIIVFVLLAAAFILQCIEPVNPSHLQRLKKSWRVLNILICTISVVSG